MDLAAHPFGRRAESAARLMLARMSDAVTILVAVALGGALAEHRLAERARHLVESKLGHRGTTTEWIAMDLLGVETDAELVGRYSSSIATSAMPWTYPWPSLPALPTNRPWTHRRATDLATPTPAHD